MSGVRVYVGGIPKTAENKDVEEAFERFGKITNVWIARNPPGFAFLDFEDPRDAEDAIREVDGKEVLGERVRVQLARGGIRKGGKDDRGNDRRDDRPRSSDRDRRRDYSPDRRDRGRSPRRDSRSSLKVRISGLSRRVDWRDVKAFVHKVGDVTFCDMDGDDAIVELATQRDLDAVVRKLDDAEFEGRRIRVRSIGGDSRPRSRSPRRRGHSASRSPRRRQSRSPSPGRKNS